MFPFSFVCVFFFLIRCTRLQTWKWFWDHSVSLKTHTTSSSPVPMGTFAPA